jgi:hypothetical protein
MLGWRAHRKKDFLGKISSGITQPPYCWTVYCDLTVERSAFWDFCRVKAANSIPKRAMDVWIVISSLKL